jgi:hypothetical protein
MSPLVSCFVHRTVFATAKKGKRRKESTIKDKERSKRTKGGRGQRNDNVDDKRHRANNK